MQSTDNKIDELEVLLNDVFHVLDRESKGDDATYRELNKAADKVAIEKYVQFEEIKPFKDAIQDGKLEVFHYGILVYDNYDLVTTHNTLIPFKHVYAKQKTKDPLEALRKILGQSESNARDFLYKNKRNAEIVKGLGNNGYLVFSHDMEKNEDDWYVKGVTRNKEYCSVDGLEELEQLWNTRKSVLRIFLEDIMRHNGFTKGTMFTGMKVLDVDVEGRSSSYLLINTNNEELLNIFMTDPFRQWKIGLLVSAVRSLYTKIHIDLQRREAIKSAKAAIMSRNMSHNLGSHVMSYLKQNFSSAQEMVANGSLLEVVPKEANVECKEMPLLVGMGKFISYLQERQDYIATVSTDYIPYPSVVNFKDAIYDELNPDYRYQRHTEWQGHKPANILLQNIAKSEGLSREVLVDGAIEVQKENNISIKYGEFDGLNCNNKDYEKLRDWNFALPGGSMGRQAIFSIVENVIRNAAKHGARKPGDSLEIRFDIIDPFVDTEKLESDFKEYKGKVDDLYIVTLTDNVKTAETDVKSINNVINKSFYDEGTDLTASNKGIKEMIISAAWLRGIKIEEQNMGDTAPIIEARRNKDGYLQYVFCFPKVKEVAFIVADNNSEWLGKRKDEVWIKKGWYVFTLEEYKKQSKNFNFVILDKVLKDKKDDVRKISSSRFFVASDVTDLKKQEIKFIRGLENLSSEKELDETKEELFKELAEIDEGFKISIYDKKDEKGNAHVEAYDNEESIPNKKYIFRKHNDTDKEFIDFLHKFKGIKGKSFIDALNGVEFAEGITGGNSTDRLLRHTERDLLWAYQHAHAMKTRVAIFDERIFTRITGFEMSQLKEGESLPINWKDELDGIELHRARQKVNAYDASHGRKKSANEILNASKEELLRFVQENYPVSDPVMACELIKVAPLIYNKKGIDVYTLTRMDETVNRFAIWGMRFELNNISTNTKDESHDGDGDKWKSNKYGYVEKVAELSFVEVVDDASQNGEQVNKKWLKPELKLFEKGKIVTKKDFDYDYLSIHQGLLDKVYEIKKNMTVEEKQRITKALHECYVKNNCDNSVMDYLPGLVIHSGRSKPNKDDMPQHQPFIQYSAIENAVSDCKFTLVELLDFACYEQ